jgi:hypothetical protein
MKKMYKIAKHWRNKTLYMKLKILKLKKDVENVENGNDVEEGEKEKRKAKNAEYYERIARYLRRLDKIEDEEDDIKVAASEYVIKEDGKLFTKGNVAVIYNDDDAQRVIEMVHKDLGHYGKLITKEAVKKRYIVAPDVWEKGERILDACIPCQLYKRPQKTTETATIHPYGIKEPFPLWEIDFVGPIEVSYSGNRYLITAIDYATSKALLLLSMKLCNRR